jgi:hypothetical protein
MILGTISAVDNDSGLQLIIDGEDLPTTKKYTYMASYVPAANDRVLIEEISGSYVIMGKVINDVASSGIVREATNATNATNAVTAESCTGNAATATTAASCSGNAATATTASSCTGNAATATTASQTNGFSFSCPSTAGMLVTNVTRTYNSTLGSYIVTDVQTSTQANFTHK